MSNQDRIDDIIGLLREAELDEGVWSAASALIDEVCELRGNDLLLGRLNPQGGIEVVLRWLRLRGEPAPELARDYADNYAAIDERGRAGIRQAPGALAHTTALLPEGVRRTSATYNEYLVPNAGENCLTCMWPGPSSARGRRSGRLDQRPGAGDCLNQSAGAATARGVRHARGDDRGTPPGGTPGRPGPARGTVLPACGRCAKRVCGAGAHPGAGPGRGGACLGRHGGFDRHGDARAEAAVRWHIREALGRLGLSRQADLVGVVLYTPGVFDDGD